MKKALRELWCEFRPVRKLQLSLNAEALAECLSSTLLEMVARTESDRRALRDSIVEHMARETELRHEIASLNRHLAMAIDERDRSRALVRTKRKK